VIRLAVRTCAGLRDCQITSHGSELLIRLGRHDAPLPGPLAAATRQLTRCMVKLRATVASSRLSEHSPAAAASSRSRPASAVISSSELT
jgi:hypothetical protein